MLFSKTNKKYDEIELDEILEILTKLKPTTAEVMKPTIRKFYKHHKNSAISENIPSNSKVLSRQTKGKESVLSPDEINKIIETPKDPRDRAIIETFITTGIRNSELRNIKISNININDNITTWITIARTKTNTTCTEQKIPIVPNPKNPVAKFPKHLRQWYKMNQHLPQDNYLFYSKTNNTYNKQLTKRGLQLIIDRTKIKAEINKKITPHIFRHTSATYDGISLTQNMLCQKYGWENNTKMLKKYCHHNEKQLEQQLIELAGLTEEEQTKGRTCPNCGEINNINDETCKKCNRIIHPKKLEELYNKNLLIAKEINKTEEDNYIEKENQINAISKLEKDNEELNKKIKHLSNIIGNTLTTKTEEAVESILTAICEGSKTKEEAIDKLGIMIEVFLNKDKNKKIKIKKESNILTDKK